MPLLGAIAGCHCSVKVGFSIFDFNKLWGACVMRRAPERTSPPRRRTRRRWTLRQASCQGQFVVCFAVSVCFFLCSFELASQFSSCSVCSMTSTSFWQDGQAEISIQKARDLALLKPNARIFKPRQFRGIVRVLDESRQEAGRVTKF